ncbi:hypothetical protein ABRQ22_00700 [Cellulosimicrobium sp. ES-005]|uniref:Lipoprotein n=1 Tax=Cellulosimicrobium sp. ES-005 TaxID=3163031 RepID=A0AAU8G239_9MICO
MSLRRSTRRRVAAAALAALVPLLAACGTPDSVGSSVDDGTAVDVPAFDGPYAAEFTAFYSDAGSDFARQALADEEITDAEYAEMEEKFRTCLEAEGVTFSGFEPDGSYEASPLPDGSDPYEVVKTCERESSADTVGALHDIMASNPDNLDVPTIMAECLVRREVVPAGYAADDYLTDMEGRFSDLAALSTELREALTSCSSDPLGLAGE